jgi:DNA-directed RNA polymerase subunit H (RpoH/RPB5)
MSNILFEQYKNVQTFLVKYRGFELKNEKFYDEKTFNLELQQDEYISHICSSPLGKAHMYLFNKKNTYVNATKQFQRILGKLGNTPENYMLIFITYEPLNVYIKKALIKFQNTFETKFQKSIQVLNLLHKMFILDLQMAPHCGKHSILSRDEILKIVKFPTLIDLNTLCHIYDDDPQILLIGGLVGDIIRIDALSNITGKTIRYRKVVPRSKTKSRTVVPKINTLINVKPLDDAQDKSKADDDAKKDDDVDSDIEDFDLDGGDASDGTGSDLDPIKDDVDDDEEDEEDDDVNGNVNSDTKTNK